MERMLTVFRRHSPKCKHKSREQTKCNCPCWIDGTLNGARILQSAHTRNWTLANRRALDMEITGAPPPPVVAEVSTAEAVERFHADQAARGLAPASIRKYRQTSQLLLTMARDKGCRVPSQITREMILEMRQGWSYEGSGHAKQLERLRSMFRHWSSCGWIKENPCAGIRPPLVPISETLPLEPDEVQRLITACDRYPFPQHEEAWRRRRAVAFILVLRYTGLRLGDAVRLTAASIDGQGRITVAKMGKTQRPVKVMVPSFVLTALEGCQQADGTYFITGRDPRAAEGAWWKFLKRLATFAKVENVHPHRFRDTFSVELLKAGVPLEDVSRLLGHTSIKTTERHYAPWVASRQERLDSAVRLALGDTNSIQDRTTKGRVV